MSEYRGRYGIYYGKIFEWSKPKNNKYYGLIALYRIKRYGVYDYKYGKTIQKKGQFKVNLKFWFVLIMETELEEG